MRKLNQIIIHCSATHEGVDVDAATIKQWHLKRGFNDIGYHFLIKLNGDIEPGRSIEKIGAHCSGYNSDSIGICYVGGLDQSGKPKDTRTEKQKESMRNFVGLLKERYNIKIVKGHRDYSPDKDGNGKIEKWEWIKSCPCFEVSDEF